MGSFDYNDDYSSFENLLERCEVFNEGGKGLGGYHSGFGRDLTGRLRDVGSTAVPRDSRKFVVHVLYTQLQPNIITDEDLTELESAGPEAGSRYNLTLQKILDTHKDEITKRADEIGQVIEDRFPALANEILGRGPQRIQGNIDARKAKLAAKEIANDIKQGEDIDDSIDDALDSVLVQAAINKVLTNIQTSLGEPGLDIEEEALQEVVDYAERIQTVDQLTDFIRQIAKEPGYQKIALYLSAVVKPLRGNKPEEDFEDDESAPYRSMYEPGDSENAYAEGESEAQSTEVEDEEDVISRESLNNNMRKRKLLFEKKKNWMKGAVKKPGALNAAAKAAGKSKSEYCASPPSGKAEKRCNLWKTFNKHRPEDEEDTEKEKRYKDRWGKDLDREREREGSSSAGEYSDVDKDDFCGPAGGAAPGTYPVNSEKRARAALSYAHNAPDPEGIKRCVYKKAKEHGWFDEEDEEFSMSPMLDSHKTDTSGYLTEQIAKDKRNKVKSRTENQSFKERFKPKTHWQLQELRRRGL